VTDIQGVVLFPGAGSSADHSSLVAIAAALAPLPVMRVDFAYRRLGRKIPDRAPVLIRAVREAVDDACRAWSCAPTQLVIGGRSMGGRMCSMAVAGFDGNDRNDRVSQPADAPLQVGGLVCISYPLHPPKQPAKLRIAHLPQVRVPSLFVSGTRDEFATPAELGEHLAVVPVAPTVRWVEGARHDLRGHDDHVAGIVASVVAEWARGASAQPLRT
jgi:predicted alpha/beta-hydrolase family hydrolase